MDLIALRTAFFTGVGFFAFFATTGFFFTTGFFATGFLPSSANGFVGRLGSDGPSAFFAAGFAAGFFAAGFAVVFLTTVFLAGAFFGAGVARLDRAAFTCIVERVRV